MIPFLSLLFYPVDNSLSTGERNMKRISITIFFFVFVFIFSPAASAESAKGLYRKGTWYFFISKMDKAVDAYSKAIELDPSFEKAYFERGRTLAFIGKHEEAVKDFTKVIELNPKAGRAYHDRGISYKILGSEKEAIEDMKTSARLGYRGAQIILRTEGIDW